MLPHNLKQTENDVAKMNEGSFDEQNVMAGSFDTEQAAEVIKGGKCYIAALCVCKSVIILALDRSGGD